MPIDDDVFTPLLGLRTWQVNNFHGSMFTMEFGEPRLYVGEVKTAGLYLENGPKDVSKRQTFAYGEWTLEVLYCAWELRLGDVLLAHSETEEPYMARALTGYLQGQALTGANLDRDAVRTTFTFDLGATLTTFSAGEPYGPGSDHWVLIGQGMAWTFDENGNVHVEHQAL